MQKSAEGPEIPPIISPAPPVPMWVVLHAPAPAVGSSDARTFPLKSTAKQTDCAEQETSVRRFPESIVASCQAPLPPMAFVEVATSPSSSTAAQSDFVGHETEVKL